MTAAHPRRSRQTATGISLAALIMGCWLVLHIYSVFFHRLQDAGWVPALLMIPLICWLNVGLFIVAHDCMHGSLAPGHPRLNRWVGRAALALYAGFSFDRLLPKHFEHHRRPGTDQDPDFHASHPGNFWRWYAAFFREYFGIRELLILTGAVAVYVLLLGAPYFNLLLFWALPAILSSLQLFLFGTFLPHRHHEDAFSDHHNARSNDFGGLLSLLTCFHFGYHHEHHRSPGTPWWRLPRERVRSASPR